MCRVWDRTIACVYDLQVDLKWVCIREDFRQSCISKMSSHNLELYRVVPRSSVISSPLHLAMNEGWYHNFFYREWKLKFNFHSL